MSLSVFDPVEVYGCYAWLPARFLPDTEDEPTQGGGKPRKRRGRRRSGWKEANAVDVTTLSAERILEGADFSDAVRTELLPRLAHPETVAQFLPCSVGDRLVAAPVYRDTTRFPYIAPTFVALAFAKARGCDLNRVDFVFDGSTLSRLATRRLKDRGEEYLVQLRARPGRPPTVIAQKQVSGSAMRLNDAGHQFEQLVRGLDPLATAGHCGIAEPQCEHLQLLELCGFRVLCCAESDAQDADGTGLVEVKLGNPAGQPRARSVHSVYQVISNGSQALVTCERTKWCDDDAREDDQPNSEVHKVVRYSRAQVLGWRYGGDLGRKEDRGAIEQDLENIGQMLRALQAAAERGDMVVDQNYRMGFRDREMCLEPYRETALVCVQAQRHLHWEGLE